MAGGDAHSRRREEVSGMRASEESRPRCSEIERSGTERKGVQMCKTSLRRESHRDETRTICFQVTALTIAIRGNGRN